VTTKAFSLASPTATRARHTSGAATALPISWLLDQVTSLAACAPNRALSSRMASSATSSLTTTS
jgi:hypothetical protein